ncbi:MAG: hypothetical protein Q9195_007772 [Heterodermia aff. obscurata]
MKLFHSLALWDLILTPCASAITVAEITGNRYLSPLRGSSFTNLTGLVTATGYGAWIRSTQPDDDQATTESIHVFNLLFSYDFVPGDIVTFDGKVTGDSRGLLLELFVTEIIYPHNVRLISRGNPVEPIPLGASTSGIIGNKDMRPPTEQYNKLDNGDVFGVPNDVARISEVNAQLEPTKYGMDFFQSLFGELVTIHNVTALGRQARDNTFTGPHLWVYGNWPVTGNNSRGGLTVRDRDANPETILLFDPQDGTSNPNNTKLGDSLTDVTGVVDYMFYQYYIRPVTAPSIKSSRSPTLPSPSTIKSNGRCSALSVANYNLDDFAPGDRRIPLIVNQISSYLGAPSIIFVQGVQDSSGATDDGTVDANLTLSDLTQALKERTGIPYRFIDVDPINNADGVEIGTNVRSAYIFNPSQVRLYHPNPGNSTDINSVLPGPSLRFNPGRIDAPPTFDHSPKPLAAQWETIDGKGVFFTVNVEWIPKYGRGSLQSDVRPPWAGRVKERIAQAQVTGSFTAQILAQDQNAAIVAAGDFRDFAFIEHMKHFVQVSGLQNMDVLGGIPEVERYTSNSGNQASGGQEQFTHMFVSPSIARSVQKGDFEHVHVNTWAGKEDAASEYDPSVAKLNSDRATWLQYTEESCQSPLTICEVDQGLHGMDTIERFVIKALQVMIVHKTNVDGVCESLRINLLLGSANLILGDINTRDEQTLTSQLKSDMTVTSSDV